MEAPLVISTIAVFVVAAPAMLLTILGLAAIVDHPLSERAVSRLTFATVVTGLAAAVSILAWMLMDGTRQVTVSLGDLAAISDGSSHFHLTLKLVFDRLSVPLCILSFVLCGTVGAFASIYMHREAGFGRFFVFYSVFLLGIVVSFVAGTVETLFAGWELVGLSSALLVAFFQERPAPVRNGLHVWSVYRVADAAFVLAAVLLHHLAGEGDFTHLTGTGPWPQGTSLLPAHHALIVGLLLLIAAAGKSAVVPFSGWLPRAMEGPTPSSAIFYGALSVHLGAFLLLRVDAILERSQLLCAIVVALGLITALYGAIVGRVQGDVKSALSFACLTQVGLIVAEIGAGFRYIALAHIVGHACLRTLQFVRAPSLLHDYHNLENAIGAHLPRSSIVWERLIPPRYRTWAYRFALERGYLDSWLNDVLVARLRAAFQWCDRQERRWSGRPDAHEPAASTRIGSLEELS
jgi:NAD(P)H-quinone oxidoreductase subunit 5